MPKVFATFSNRILKINPETKKKKNINCLLCIIARGVCRKISTKGITMKKLIALGALAGSCFGLSSGLFVAGDIGVELSRFEQHASVKDPKIVTSNNNNVQQPSGVQKGNDVGLGINTTYGYKAGLILAPNRKSGLRIYGSYDAGTFSYGTALKENEFPLTNLKYYSYGAGADLMIGFGGPNTLGIALGGGVDFIKGDLAKFLAQRPGSRNMIPYANVAVYQPVGKLLFELGVKVPVVALQSAKITSSKDKFYLDGHACKQAFGASNSCHFEKQNGNNIEKEIVARFLPSIYAQISLVF